MRKALGGPQPLRCLVTNGRHRSWVKRANKLSAKWRENNGPFVTRKWPSPGVIERMKAVHHMPFASERLLKWSDKLTSPGDDSRPMKAKVFADRIRWKTPVLHNFDEGGTSVWIYKFRLLGLPDCGDRNETLLFEFSKRDEWEFHSWQDYTD